MNHWNFQRYLASGHSQKRNTSVLDSAVSTAALIRKAAPGAAILFTLNHLARETGVPYYYLRDVAARGGRNGDTFYRVFSLKKTNVGFKGKRTRTVCAPDPLLMKVQRWIHEHILTKRYPHNASSAYQPGSRIRDAAAQHRNARWLVKMDVMNFFESVLEPKVYEVFRSFGYQPLIAFELTRLCTRVRKGGPKRYKVNDTARIVRYSSNSLGHLPQGAPTSPLLANLAVFDLDCELDMLAKSNGMVYTRYADDIVFSSSADDWSKSKAVTLLKRGHDVLKSHGFQPNLAKATIAGPGGRKVVLGLSVSGAEPRLTRDFKNKLRAHIYYLKRFQSQGIPSHEILKFDSSLGLQRHVFGLAYYAMGIERSWGSARLAELKALHWPVEHGISFV
jgi:RNA-directed DNA polymerase